MQQAIDRATNEKTDFDIEHRLLMPDGSIKHLHVVAHALQDASGIVHPDGPIRDIHVVGHPVLSNVRPSR